MNPKSIIETFMNGNLTDAKEKAKKVSLKAITDYLELIWEYDYNKALLIACYLKGQITFADLCNNLNNSK